MKCKLMNYHLQLIDCTHVAAKQNDELQDKPPKQWVESIYAYPYIKPVN